MKGRHGRAVDLEPVAHAEGTAHRGRSEPGDGGSEKALDETFDPLRLCVFATVAAITWAAGPFAVLFFAGLGLAGYWRARRGGLLTSRCLLRDTRLVLAYLALIGLTACWGIWRVLT